MTKEQINTASKIWYQNYGMGYNTPAMSEGELEEHFNMDRFRDSLERVRVDIECAMISYPTISGLYEIEVIKMLRAAMTKAEVIKGKIEN